MRILLTVDVVLQILIVVLSLIFAEDLGAATLIIAVLLCTWQLISSLIHLIWQRRKVSIARLAYSITGVLLLVLLLTIGINGFLDNLVKGGAVILFPVVMAAYYFFLSIYELIDVLKNRNELHNAS